MNKADHNSGPFGTNSHHKGVKSTASDGLSIVQICTADPRYEFAEELLESAFPEDERRDRSQQRQYADSNPLFHSCLIIREEEPIGILNYWDFGTAYYIEHFATSPHVRNSGIGGRVLEVFARDHSLRIILEAELPTDELSRRRIGFYQRHGLAVVDEINYVQPPYREGGHSLPMKILAHPTLTLRDCQTLCHTIHREVYGVSDK